MARIAGVNIPTAKKVGIALTYIYGIGLYRSKQICEKANIDKSIPVSRLSDDEVMSCENDVTVYVNYLTEIKNYLNSLNTDDELFVGLV